MKKNEIALTPPMGWNSWDCYGNSVNEEQLLGNAQYMADHLKESGWEYVSATSSGASPTPAKRAPTTCLRLAHLRRVRPPAPGGRALPLRRGGQGLRPHRREDPQPGAEIRHPHHAGRAPAGGAPAPAGKGTDTTCDKIASDASVCRWNTDMYGIDASKEGAQAYYGLHFLSCMPAGAWTT